MRFDFTHPAGRGSFVIAVAFLGIATWAPALSAGQADPQVSAVSMDNSDTRDPEVREPADGRGQNWNWHVQNTEIVQGYPAFPASYSGPNSLPSGGQVRETVSADLYVGVRLWTGAEAHFDGLMWQGFGLHDTSGIDAFPSGEAFKAGTAFPRLNIARLFIRQTIGLDGEEREKVPDDQLTLAGTQDVSRVTFTLGRFSAKDIFDNNAYANDPRTQFMNWALMANAAWDYPADALGYTTGLTIELNQPNWALRYGFFQMPRLKNAWTTEDGFLIWPGYSGTGDGEFFHFWGMAGEFERRYSINAHPGAVRFLAYLNHARMGSYQAALSVPGVDISRTREYRYKYGFGLNWEQEIVKDIGVFSRLGWNDGHNEAWMFTDINYSGSAGVSLKGEAWHRPGDTFGLAGVMSGISRATQEFLAAGGTDNILDGDGALNYGWEKILETYYDCKIWKGVHVALDYQFVSDPAFNRARGPVSVFATRLHMDL